jgi:hypothetical protein
MSGILRDAVSRKGNYGLGKATYNEAMEIGKAWVGEGYSLTKKGYYLSKDGLRLFRPPSFKPKLGIMQANFQYKVNNQVTTQWLANGHLDIIK